MEKLKKTIMHSLPISKCCTEHCIHLKLTARMHALNWAAPSFAHLGTLTVPRFLCVSRDFTALQTCVWARLFGSFNIFIWEKKKKYCRISSYTLYLTYKTFTSVHGFCFVFVFDTIQICLFLTIFWFGSTFSETMRQTKTFIKLIFDFVSANVSVNFIS